MDKNSRPLKIFIIIALVFIFILGIRYANHKKELSTLLKKQDIASIYQSNKVEVTSDKKIKNYSSNVSKKSKNTKDFIADSKAINNSSSDKVDGKDNETINIIQSNSVSYTNEDLDLLARLIYSEAGSEPYLGKVAVANVVLYRVRENKQTLEEVIYAQNQFDGVETNQFTNKPPQESINAAIEALNGVNVVPDGYFFVNLNLADPQWAKEKTFIARIGDHWFFEKE